MSTGPRISGPPEGSRPRRSAAIWIWEYRGAVINRQRVLIYRLGSLGDTVVALPAFRLIASAFPDAERWALTGSVTDPKAAPLSQLLEGTGLVHGYIDYPLRVRSPRALMGLRREIRDFRPDVLVYLAEPRGILKAYRDVIFFWCCGVRRLVGVPLTGVRQRRRHLGAGIWEYEGARLLRCLRSLGRMPLDSADAFPLGITPAERATAAAVVGGALPSARSVAVSVGAKVDVKDWGAQNWAELLKHMDARLRGWTLIFVGAAAEWERSERLRQLWSGLSFNLCGRLSVRESAAVLEGTRLFVGHDSGPMHLAAAVGTPCVGIFSSRNLPGEWFPKGTIHRIIYKNVPCRGCNLDVCLSRRKVCINSISVDEVVREVLSASGLRQTSNPIHLSSVRGHLASR